MKRPSLSNSRVKLEDVSNGLVYASSFKPKSHALRYCALLTNSQCVPAHRQRTGKLADTSTVP